MNKFENLFQYFVYLRGVGNPDFSQYSDIAPPKIDVVSTLEDAVTACLGYIQNWNLGGGNWGSDHPSSECRSGNVFDLDGTLKYRISYNGVITSASGTPWKNRYWEVQFRSYNKWQTNRLEKALFEVADKVITEDWTGAEPSPAAITFCNIRNQSINQIIAIAQSVSPYIHLGHIE